MHTFFALTKEMQNEYYKMWAVHKLAHIGGESMKTPNMPLNPHLAFAYVPYQDFKNLYTTDKALWRGTMFKDLDIPFSTYKNNPIMNPFIKK